MGFIVKLAGIVKKLHSDEVTNWPVSDANDLFTEEWREFLSGEYEQSVAKNNKELGNRPRCVPNESDSD